MNGNDDFKKFFLKSLLHCILTLLSFIFLTPFNVWRKAIIKTAKQREEGALKMGNIDSLWPFLSYLKRLTCDFMFDALIVLSYIIGVVASLIALVTGNPLMFLYILLGSYFIPPFIAIMRDNIQLFLIPFRKFLSWGAKPAQYIDLNVKKKEIQ